MHSGGMRALLLVQAAVAVAAAVAVVVAVRVPAAFPIDAPAAVSLGWLRRDRVLWLLAGLLFGGIGVFNVVATWLDAILTHFGNGDASGTLIAVMTVSGIAGAAVLPEFAARYNRRRALLVTAAVVTVVVFATVAAVHSTIFVGLALALDGFVLLACLPVALDWSELHVGPQRAGTATGFLMLVGNLGGVLYVLVVQTMIGNPYLSLAALAVLALPMLAIATRLPTPGRAGKVDTGRISVCQE
jgi:predicted MFS family arabinose efflux permease